MISNSFYIDINRGDIMKVMIITSSPNKEGLTAACGNAAENGVVEAGAEAVRVSLNELNIGACHACGNGWGTCLSNNECQVEDDFQNLHNKMSEADAFVFVTPVYWGEMSESVKAFFDRIRRCEAWKKENSFLEGKPVLSVAAAGGSGNGTLSCLTQMERLLMHTKAERFDYISINRKTREFKLDTIKASAKSLVKYMESK
jgi:multimeric flavodoxin WrbA